MISMDWKILQYIISMEQSEDGYKNFTVIKCHIKSIEWLYLAAWRKGKFHRRAKQNLISIIQLM